MAEYNRKEKNKAYEVIVKLKNLGLSNEQIYDLRNREEISNFISAERVEGVRDVERIFRRSRRFKLKGENRVFTQVDELLAQDLYEFVSKGYS